MMSVIPFMLGIFCLLSLCISWRHNTSDLLFLFISDISFHFSGVRVLMLMNTSVKPSLEKSLFGYWPWLIRLGNESCIIITSIRYILQRCKSRHSRGTIGLLPHPQITLLNITFFWIYEIKNKNCTVFCFYITKM